MSEFVTTKCLAERLGVSQRYVQKLVHDGAIPHLRLGPKSIRIASVDAEQFLQSRRITTP